MKPMFSYLGSKWRLAKKYGPPQTNLTIEPFAGGACYSLYWNIPNVILYDKNPIIAGIWDYLIKTKEQEILALPIDFESTNDLLIPQEAKWLIGFWLTKGNVNPNKTRSVWGKQYRHLNNCIVWNEYVRTRISIQVSKIRNWKCYCKDYIECPDIEADWFIDPPYEVAGKCYKFSNIDYKQLAQFCLNRKGKITVCENEGATWLPFEPFSVAAGTHGKVRRGISYEAVYQINNLEEDNGSK
jgi:site-specific DNA-adenine methylase